MRDNKKRNEDKKTIELDAKQKARLENINNILRTLPLANWEWPRIGLAILKERALSYTDKTLDNLLQIHMQGPIPIFLNYTRTDLARNKLAMEVLKTPQLTHLLMLDIDHKHPIDIVQRLAKWVLLNPDIKVVGGLNFRRSYPHDPCCHLFGEDGQIYAPAVWDHEGLLQVAAIGTGSILISREVFEEIQPPWFFNLYDNVWDDSWPGEDMGFSQKCRQYGYKMYVDTDLTSTHIGEYEIGENNFRAAIEKGDLFIKNMEGVKLVN